MTDRMQVAEGERGVVRLFAVDVAPAARAAFAEPGPDWPAKAALGAETLDPDFVEVFDAGDLAGVGLADYLIQGAGIGAGQIAGDRARLNGLTGAMMVVTSGAFGGHAQTLTPHAPLRWIGTWTEERPPVVFEPLPDASAKSRMARVGPGDHPAPRLGSLGISVLLAIGLVVALAAWWGMRG